MAWNVLFGVVNLWRIWLAILERRSTSTQQRRAGCWSSPHISRSSRTRQYRKLLDCGQWENGPATSDAQPSVRRSTGSAGLDGGGRFDRSGAGGMALRRAIQPGDFVGETAFLAKGPMAADIHIVEPVRCMSWSTEALDQFMEDNPQIGALLQRILGQCLVRKLDAHT